MKNATPTLKEAVERAEALAERRSRMRGCRQSGFTRPPEELRAATGIDVLHEWRIPVADPFRLESALSCGQFGSRPFFEMADAAVLVIALANPGSFRHLFDLMGQRIEGWDPYSVATGALSGFPPACIADWCRVGTGLKRSPAYRERRERIERAIGAGIGWVASDATLDEIERQVQARLTRRTG